MCLDDIKLGLGSCVVTFLEKAVPVQLTVCSLCITSICNFWFFPFWFQGRHFGSDRTSSWPLLTIWFSIFVCSSDVKKTFLLYMPKLKHLFAFKRTFNYINKLILIKSWGNVVQSVEKKYI